MKHSRLERYLKQATQGLQGKKRAAVILELRGNLEQHVKERMAFGVAENRALEEVLDDFGAPQLVLKGMWGVHMKPLWTKAGVGVGLVMVLGLPMLLASASSVSVLRQDSSNPYVWVGLDSVFRALEWKDANLSLIGKKLKVTKGKQVIFSTNYTQQKFADSSIKVQKGETYIGVDNLIGMLSVYQGSIVTFNQPINTRFKIGSQTLDFTGLGFNVDLGNLIALEFGHHLFNKISKFLPNGEEMSWSTINLGSGYQHYVKGSAEANHPYLDIWTGFENLGKKGVVDKNPSARFGILQSDLNGDFKFKTSHREVYFATKWENLAYMKNNQILLVKMTGRINPSSYGKYTDLIDPSSILKIPVSIGQKVN